MQEQHLFFSPLSVSPLASRSCWRKLLWCWDCFRQFFYLPLRMTLIRSSWAGRTVLPEGSLSCWFDTEGWVLTPWSLMLVVPVTTNCSVLSESLRRSFCATPRTDEPVPPHWALLSSSKSLSSHAKRAQTDNPQKQPASKGHAACLVPFTYCVFQLGTGALWSRSSLLCDLDSVNTQRKAQAVFPPPGSARDSSMTRQQGTEEAGAKWPHPQNHRITE